MTARTLFALLLAALAPAPAGGDAGSALRWEPERRLTVEPAPSRLSYNFARSIAVDERGRVHAVWYDSRDGRPQIYYKRSEDAGATWGPDTRLSDGTTADENPAIAVSGSNVYVVWHRIREGRFFDVFLRRSADGGSSWEEPAALTDGHSSAHASVAASGPAVHVVWGDSRHGAAEVYTRHSSDFGATWGWETRLTDRPYESWVPTVAVSNADVFVAWVDYRDGNEEEYFKRSSDGGVTWGPDTRLTEDDADSWAASLAISGRVVYLAWFDRRDAGIMHSDVERTLDELLALLRLPADPAPPPDPAVYYLPGFLARVEEKRRRIEQAAPAWVAKGGDPGKLEAGLTRFESAIEAWSFGWEIYFKRSTDGGASWEPDVRLTSAEDVSARPSIAAAGDELHVVWFDGRDGNFEIYAKRSADGGTTWSGDVRLSDSPGESAHPSVAVSKGFVHVLWHDTRDGNAEIYYRRGAAARKKPLPATPPR